MLKRIVLLVILLAAIAGGVVLWQSASRSHKSEIIPMSPGALHFKLTLQSPAPIPAEQLENTREIIIAQLEELQKSAKFQYTLEAEPPGTLSLHVTGLQSAAETNLLRNSIAPPQGTIVVYLLPDRYSLVSEPSADSIPPTFLFLDQRANMRQTPAKKVLQESKLIVSAEDFRPLPKTKIFSTPGKPDRWMITFTFYPEPAQRFARITKSHRGRNLALVIDGKIIAAPKITTPVLDGKFVLSLSSPLKDNSPEAQRLKQDLNKRPLPLPVLVEEIKEQS